MWGSVPLSSHHAISKECESKRGSARAKERERASERERSREGGIMICPHTHTADKLHTGNSNVVSWGLFWRSNLVVSTGIVGTAVSPFEPQSTTRQVLLSESDCDPTEVPSDAPGFTTSHRNVQPYVSINEVACCGPERALMVVLPTTLLRWLVHHHQCFSSFKKTKWMGGGVVTHKLPRCRP